MDGGGSDGAPQAVDPATDLRWIEPGKSRERSGVQRRLLRGVRTWSVAGSTAAAFLVGGCADQRVGVWGCSTASRACGLSAQPRTWKAAQTAGVQRTGDATQEPAGGQGWWPINFAPALVVEAKDKSRRTDLKRAAG